MWAEWSGANKQILRKMETSYLYIYSNLDFTNKSAGATRMLYYAKAIASDSHKVYLVSCCSNGLTDANFTEIEPNVFICDEKKPTTGLWGTFAFVRNLVSFSNTKGPDKSFLFYPSPLVYLETIGLLYLKLYRKFPVFSELNEIRKHSSSFHAPISFRNVYYSLKKILYKSVFTLMQGLLRYYDGLICISTAMESYAAKYNKNRIRVPILTNPDITIYKSKKTYGIRDSFNIGFSGSILPSKENLDNFMSVYLKLRNEGFGISFNLCGPVSDRIHDDFFGEELTNNNVTYYGNLDKKELSGFLDQQDLLVIPRGYTLQNAYGFSTKLSDYLNHKKVILITDVSDNKLFIKDGVNGFIVPPDDNGHMYQKLVYIIKNFNDVKDTIIPNALATSKDQFHYILFSDPLRKFLFQDKNRK